MIRRRRAGARGILVGLAVAAMTAGGTAAATSTFSVNLHARLAPVAGTKSAGQFEGVLVKVGGGITPATLPAGSQWRLTWRLTLPALDGPAAASLRIGSERHSSSLTRVLCTRCARTATGTMTLKGPQGKRVSKGRAVVVVRTRSARLRGPVKVSLQTSAMQKG